jgi:hypothetical protein
VNEDVPLSDFVRTRTHDLGSREWAKEANPTGPASQIHVREYAFDDARPDFGGIGRFLCEWRSAPAGKKRVIFYECDAEHGNVLLARLAFDPEFRFLMPSPRARSSPSRQRHRMP